MQIRTRLVCTLSLLLPLVAVEPSLAAKNGSAVASASKAAEAGKLSVANVKSLVDGKDIFYIFDTNDRESYLAGHIPGAQWIAYDAVGKANLPKDKNAKLVFYCYNPFCGASPQAAKDALSLGYRNVWLMPDGITRWRAAKLPVIGGAKPK